MIHTLSGTFEMEKKEKKKNYHESTRNQYIIWDSVTHGRMSIYAKLGADSIKSQ